MALQGDLSGCLESGSLRHRPRHGRSLKAVSALDRVAVNKRGAGEGTRIDMRSIPIKPGWKTGPKLIAPMVLITLLTGCSSGNDRLEVREPAGPTASPEVVIGHAKGRTQRTEREIAEVVPERSRIRQQEKGTLFPCGEHQRQWAGGTDVVVTGEPDMDAVVAVVEQEWAGRSGWAIDKRQDTVGLATIDISTDDGEGYLVSRGTEVRTVHIRSSSSCFAVPEVFFGGGAW